MQFVPSYLATFRRTGTARGTGVPAPRNITDDRRNAAARHRASVVPPESGGPAHQRVRADRSVGLGRALRPDARAGSAGDSDRPADREPAPLRRGRRHESVPGRRQGEICIGGVGVGRGYLFDEARTRAVFRDDPFSRNRARACIAPATSAASTRTAISTSSAAATSRSRSVAIASAPGNRSRADRSAGISHAVVVARETSDAEMTLCAYASGTGWTPPRVRDALRDTLPAHMVPDTVMLLPALPVMPNGKVNRARCRSPMPRRSTACRPNRARLRSASPRCSAAGRTASTPISSSRAAKASRRSSWSAGSGAN